MGSILAVVAVFQLEVKNENARVSRFLAHAEDARCRLIWSPPLGAPPIPGVSSMRHSQNLNSWIQHVKYHKTCLRWVQFLPHIPKS